MVATTRRSAIGITGSQQPSLFECQHALAPRFSDPRGSTKVASAAGGGADGEGDDHKPIFGNLISPLRAVG